MRNGDDSLNRINSFNQFFHEKRGLSTERQNVRHDSSQLQKQESIFTKSKKEVRQLLYPELPIDCLSNDELWVYIFKHSE